MALCHPDPDCLTADKKSHFPVFFTSEMLILAGSILRQNKRFSFRRV